MKHQSDSCHAPTACRMACVAFPIVRCAPGRTPVLNGEGACRKHDLTICLFIDGSLPTEEAERKNSCTRAMCRELWQGLDAYAPPALLSHGHYVSSLRLPCPFGPSSDPPTKTRTPGDSADINSTCARLSRPVWTLQNMVGFDQIPDELDVHIIGFLGRKYIAAARLVNRRLEKLCVEKLFERVTLYAHWVISNVSDYPGPAYYGAERRDIGLLLDSSTQLRPRRHRLH
jgi:hypothetical protein